MEAFALAVAALAGMVVGSFLNVVVWRLPRGESVVSPRSRCPACGQAILWYDNVPVLSWLALRRRCRACGAPISARYPFVEAASGALFVLAWLAYAPHLPTAAVVAAALAALLAISLIDWDHKIIPDRISKPGILLGILLAPATQLHPPDWFEGLKPGLNQWLHAAAGAAAGALVILVIRWLGALAFRKEAMGLGDVKLLAFIGALTGPARVLYVLILASLGGAVVGALRLWWSSRRPLRFPLTVKGRDLKANFERARIGPDTITVRSATPAPADHPVRVRMHLPAAGILEDEDVHLEVDARIAAVEEQDGGYVWTLRIEGVGQPDRDRLALFASSYRYVPFGPFLALGGALTLLYGDEVHWAVTKGWPDLVRSILH
jgi:leader peptidase (prepilin peptidase)/N-methyltransferase